jgi:hypothetical protein
MSNFWKQQRQLHEQLSSKKEEYPATSLFTYKSLAEQAYKKSPLQTLDRDWHLVLKTNNNKVYQNRRTGETVNSISGSKSLKDFTNDGLQYLGFLNNPLQRQRVSETSNLIDRLNAIDKKRKITTVSHSLGSNVANRLVAEKKIDKAINFNAFIPDKSINVDDSRVVNIRNENDFASKLTKDNVNTVNLQNNSNPIKSHFMSEIKLNY